MKTPFILSLAALICEVFCSRQPRLQWDPDTVHDCIDWYDNGEGKTCEYIRSYYTITPEQFHEWNPSVGLDCKPWRWQSYCIVTQRRLDASKTTVSSSSVIISSTSTTSSLAPSPTAWKHLGCYAQNPNRPILEKNMSPNGDASLSVSKCKNSCYRRAYSFAGLQEGNQCWCSNYVAGEGAKSQTDCNIPCTGNKTEICGGNGVVNAYEALENSMPVVPSTSISAKVVGTIAGVEAVATSNGAVKNRALFGVDF